MEASTILITGGAGYIGSIITNLALRQGHRVIAVDTLWFERGTPAIHLGDPAYTFVRGDMGNAALMRPLLEGVDHVIRTAAVVGDPASNKFPELTRYTNFIATQRLITLCRQQGVRGFFFFSTCSNYGIADDLATEATALNPLSLYAETKVDIERHLMDEVHDMDWIIGRLSTVYGTSPRMRFDLTVNDFTLAGWLDKKLDLFLPESYRPYIHVFDLAQVVLSLLVRITEARHNVFNIGFPGENYQKIQIAKAVSEVIPDLAINILRDGGDKRDYQVDFTKLHRFIKLEQVHRVNSAIRDIHRMLEDGLVTDPQAPKHYNTTPELETTTIRPQT